MIPEILLASQEEELFVMKFALPLHYNEWTDEWEDGWETCVISLRRPLLFLCHIYFCSVYQAISVLIFLEKSIW
jgi:hypothetical protein